MKTAHINLYTDSGINVTQWLRLGKTFLFDNFFLAREKAVQRHSYMYEVHDNKGERLGWAVPK